MKRTSLRWMIPVFLALQLGLLWVQGAQLHRQNQVLEALREDIQVLADTIENGQVPDAFEEDGSAVPARHASRRFKIQTMAVLGVEEEQEAASKELQASRESAQKAVKDAREAQSKLSIQENVRKAEEAKKVEAATTAWQKWVYGALALVALALVARAIIQRRG